MTLSPEERRFHLGAFRQARVGLLNDAEAYLPVFVCLENLGRRLYKELSASPFFVKDLVTPLAEFLAPCAYVVSIEDDAQSHMQSLLRRLAHARNDAVHSGAYARHLGVGCLDISLIAEESLSKDMETVTDYMVRDVVVAEGWQPLSFARQSMLKNSFSWLPNWLEKKWHLLSAEAVLSALGSLERADRAKCMSTPISELLRSERISLSAATCTNENDSAAKAREKLSKKAEPLLVMDDANHLVGIVMAFDLL